MTLCSNQNDSLHGASRIDHEPHHGLVIEVVSVSLQVTPVVLTSRPAEQLLDSASRITESDAADTAAEGRGRSAARKPYLP